MPGRRNYTTPHVCIPGNNPHRNHSSERGQHTRSRLRQVAMNDFHAQFQDPIYLSAGPEACPDLYNNFDLTKPDDFLVDPPSSENPPFCRIVQEGKPTIVTTHFYFTNIKPKPIIPPSQQPQKDTSADSRATASQDEPELPINTDILQPGKIRLHSWMLYTLQAPVLDLRDTKVTLAIDLRDVFHRLHLCPEEDNIKSEQCPNGRRKSKKAKKSN